MIKILDTKKNNFDAELDKFLFNRKSKIKSNSLIVRKIIEDIKKSDICWLIAPETKNHLYKLTELFIYFNFMYFLSL